MARGGGYVLVVPAEDVDVYRFQRAVAEGRGLLAADPKAAQACLVAALTLWRGRVLGGVPEGLLSVERDRLEEERLQALEARIDADLVLGGGPALVSELGALCREHPLRERFTEQLMLALYRSGRQAHALATYREARRRLIDELGLEPGPRLRELEQAILSHDDSLGPLPVAQRLARTARNPRALAAIAAGCAALLTLVLALGSWGEHPRAAPPRPGLLLLDAATGAVRANLPVGRSEGSTRFGYGFVWTIGDNGVMSQVAVRSPRLVRSIPVGVLPGGVAVGAGGIWVTDRNSPTLLRLDPLTGQVNLRARLSQLGLRRPQPNGGVVFGGGSLWIARGSEAIDRQIPVRYACSTASASTRARAIRDTARWRPATGACGWQAATVER